MKVSKEGLLAMEDRLSELKRKLNEIGQHKGKVAIHSGDAWHDNNDFDQTEIEERRLSRQIYDLEEEIKNATIIEVTNAPGVVSLNSIVTLRLIFSEDDKEEVTYKLTDVDSSSLDSITLHSPLGKEIFGKKVGETGYYNAPMGKVKFQILSVE